jgi:membrane protein DedA with SNARE-associated domain
MLHDFIRDLIAWYLATLDSWGYPAISLLMAIESSIIPLPSELIIPPAASAIGSWVGATVMYWAARLAGRPLVLKYGRFIFIPAAKVEKAERWAARFGSGGVFVSRLLPVVRHLIGIPAGIVCLDYKLFSIYTLLGSAVWSAVLCWIGVVAGQDEKFMAGEMRQVTLWILAAIGVLGTMYYFLVHRFMRDRSQTKTPS